MKMDALGFACEMHEDVDGKGDYEVEIYSKVFWDVIKDLRSLTELPKKDFYELMKDIAELQNIDAMRFSV